MEARAAVRQPEGADPEDFGGLEDLEFVEVGAAIPEPVPVPEAAPRRGPLPARRGRTAKIVPLTRAQEYAYIHGDLERLLKIASVLLVAMIALGFFIER